MTNDEVRSRLVIRHFDQPASFRSAATVWLAFASPSVFQCAHRMNEAQPIPIFKVPARVSAVVVIIAAIFMGGATERVPQAIVLAAMGLLIIFAPPASWPDRKWTLAVLGLLALAAAGALPSAWFHTAAWRGVVQDAGIALPAGLSPQPRLTLEAWLLLASGIVWMGWLMASPWDAASRRLAARIFVCGLAALAMAVLAQCWTGWTLPGWLSSEGHGPFPNRNHTAHVLALGGVLAVGCAADVLRRSKARVVPWLLAGGVILAALATTYSRGGIVMFFSALGLWNVSVAWTRRSWKILLLGLSALFVVASALLVFGGAIAGRFAGDQNWAEDFRFRIWSDAVDLIEASPLYGSGLGNFAALFPFYRVQSVIQSGVIHPESDWLWLASETGLAGAALGLVAVWIAFAGALPLKRGTQRRLRGAALAATAAAVFHGFLDVPGHRLGSVLAALLVLALARKDNVPGMPSRFPVPAWRALGLAMVALAAWWMNFTNDAAHAEALASEGRFAAAVESANRAIARAPLDWRPYFTRAGALACTGKVVEAVADFRRARLLEPHYAEIPLQEGRFWIRRQPELAFIAWAEALRRSTGPEAPGVFGQMRMAVPDDAAFRARLLGLAEGRATLQMDWFLGVPAAEAKPHLAEIAEIAARCDEGRRKAFARRSAELGPRESE